MAAGCYARRRPPRAPGWLSEAGRPSRQSEPRGAADGDATPGHAQRRPGMTPANDTDDRRSNGQSPQDQDPDARPDARAGKGREDSLEDRQAAVEAAGRRESAEGLNA